MSLDGQKTFIEILNEIADECFGYAAASSLVRPSLTRLKQLVNDSEREICAMWDWSWLYREGTFNTVQNQTTPYYVAKTFRDVYWMTIPSVRLKLGWKSMDEWEAIYPGRYDQAGPTRPWAYIQAPPDTDLGLGYYLFPAADQVYTVNYGGILRVANMSADADVPVIPVDWQLMLLAHAKRKALIYSGVSGSDTRIQNYTNEFKDVYNRAWIRDQNQAETVMKYRNAMAERTQGQSGDFVRGVWMQN